MPGVLYVQGVELDVSVADWEPVRLGAVARGFSGHPRSTVRAVKRDHHFVGDTLGVPVEMAEVLRSLVEGEGHSWDFEATSLASSHGLLPSAVVSPGSVHAGPGGNAGFRGYALTVEDGGSVSWSTGYPGLWTVLFWHFDYVASEWIHYTMTRPSLDEFAWDVLGRRADPEDDFTTTVDPGVVTMDLDGILTVGLSGGDVLIDELAVLPYLLPTAWQDSVYRGRVAATWAPLPFVTASGTAFPRGPAKVLGQAGAAHRVPLWTNGTFGLGELVDFTLSES